MGDARLSPDEVRAAAEVHNGWSMHHPRSSPVKALATGWMVLGTGYLARLWRPRRR